MRPHMLTIENFGPFSKKVEINFDKMGNGLYLISGDTGAGKTTIFDALMYALYGVASGSARSDMKSIDYHSDFGKHAAGDKVKKDPLQVELTFSAKGNTYVVTRRITWGKNGLAQGETKESTLADQKGVQIRHNKGEESKGEVTAFINELLGMDAKQFRQIIMLSQGEFRKFLEASSKERGEILGKIYDNSVHKDVEVRIKAANDGLEKMRIETRSRILTQYQQIVKNVPDDMRVELPGETVVDDPEQLKSVAQQLEENRRKILEGLNQTIFDQSRESDSLKAQHTEANKNNKLFEQLGEAVAEQAKLKEKKEEMDLLRGRITQAERAERVMPKESAWKSAEYDAEATDRRISDLKKNLNLERETRKQLKDEADSAEKNLKPQVNELQEAVIKYQNVLDKYDAIDVARRVKRKAEKAKSDAEAGKGKAEKAKEVHEKKLADVKDELQKLEEVSESSVQLKKNYHDDIFEKREKLKEVYGNLKAIAETRRELKTKTERYTELARQATVAVKTYTDVYQRFLDGQSGFLAGELRERIRENGSAVCPVCGQMHDESSISQLAGQTENVSTRSEVDAAKDQADQAEKLERDMKDLLDKEGVKIDIAQKQVVEKASGLLETVLIWEELANGKLVKDEYQKRKPALDRAKAEFDQETESLERKKTLTKAQAELEAATRKIEDAVKAANEACSDAETNLGGAKGRLDEALKAIEGFPASKTEAEEKINEWKQKKSNLENKIETANRELKDCDGRINALEGNLTGLKDTLTEQKVKAGDLKQQYFKALKEAAFDSEESYLVALDPENTGNRLDENAIHGWIVSQKDILRIYENNVRDLGNEIRRLQGETENIKKLDIKALEEKIDDVEARLTKNREEQTSVYSQHSNINTALGEILQLQVMQKKISDALNKVKPLHSTANGNLKFETYVLDYFFESILDQANNHLDEMSGGQYRLVSKKTGDKRSEIGLDMRIYDEHTQKERATKSLSGGESFKVSLALALGLSDVAQQKSTGQIQIDCMFIDEGFGSLDEQSLQKALKVLDHLAAGHRQIGIISHVESLEQYLDQKKFVVKGSKTGSTVETKSDL